MSYLLHTEKRGEFTVELYILPEDMHPKELFDDTAYDIDEICRKIDNCTYEWFIANIIVKKNNIKLGDAYLGGNLYDSDKVKNFLKDGYYEDLVNEAITEAKENIQILCGKENN